MTSNFLLGQYEEIRNHRRYMETALETMSFFKKHFRQFLGPARVVNKSE